MLWSFGAINSHLAQSGFEKRGHLPTDFMKRKIICVGQNRHKKYINQGGYNMQITRDNYSQYANMVQQMFGNKKNSNNVV